ncbi:hypothetical protein BDF21DRAFT_219540 [Thamnidium elegans]|nr:hypothetical protein BDF21DRAFT_219540 [Thamnidium elegans]
MSTNPLRNEILRYQGVSINTVKGLSVFGIQCICNKTTLMKTAQNMVDLSFVDDETFFTCMSFTNDRAENVFYTVYLSPSGKFIEKSSCPDSSILCKHMFIVSRTHAIP